MININSCITKIVFRMVGFGNKIKSLVYKKKLYSTSLRTIEKRKVFGFTVFKRVVTGEKIETIYLKSLHLKKKYQTESVYRNLIHGQFNVVDLPLEPTTKPLVSIIVPNHNQASCLTQCLNSIYQQTYNNVEVILLDNASSDNSVEIMKAYAQKYPAKTHLLAKKKETTQTFQLWNEGLAMAHGEYIWIVESDSFCDTKFLEEVLKNLCLQSVMLSFGKCVSIQDGKDIDKQPIYPANSFVSWAKPFVMAAHFFVSKIYATKNVIPSTSAAVFRNIGTIPNEIMQEWEKMPSLGSWLFFLWLIRGGGVNYTPRALCHCKFPGENRIFKEQYNSEDCREMFHLSSFIASHYAIDLEAFKGIQKDLRQHYVNTLAKESESLESIYDLTQLAAQAKKRLPNIVICGAALTQGGGEIFPIYLANAMRSLGAPVTFIDFRNVPCDRNIRKKLDATIPLIELSSVIYLSDIFACLGTEIVHTHEGNIDRAVGHAIGNKQGRCKQIITLHGMYEAIDKDGLNYILRTVLQSCSAFVYIADKNLKPLQNILPQLRLYKIGNGLPELPVTPYRREDLGIEPNAFCITLASRAIYEKGWKEAIKAVKIAHTTLERPIHLILLGDGECYNELEKDKDLPPYIHLLGRKGDVRSYFAMSDIGLLPSYFKGESFPLVLIESLMSGTPVIASDIGEIRNMLTNEAGEMAGIVFSLNDGKVPVDVLAQHIRELASNEALYQKLKANIPSIVQKFDIYNTARQYLKVYEEALHSK